MKFFSNLFIGLIGFIKHLPEVIILLFRLPYQLWLLLVLIFRRGLRWPMPRCKCRDEIDVPPEVYKRADPLLYSQQWLMSMGVSVTWDNPDIQLYHKGLPVLSHQLQLNTEYEVRVRVWNNSYDAPAPGLPVYLTFFGFGAGSTETYLGKQTINLGAKATSQCPAFASFLWTTPQTEGHYCLQARLDWPDDANPNNNMGQENTTVGALQSPAIFEFKVKNNASIRRQFLYRVDDYFLPKPEPCTDNSDARSGYKTRLQESRARWDRALADQGYGKFEKWTDEWTVQIDPETQIPSPDQEFAVKVAIEPKNPGFKGRKAFNINVFAEPVESNERQFVGGVTLYVEK